MVRGDGDVNGKVDGKRSKRVVKIERGGVGNDQERRSGRKKEEEWEVMGRDGRRGETCGPESVGSEEGQDLKRVGEKRERRSSRGDKGVFKSTRLRDDAK